MIKSLFTPASLLNWISIILLIVVNFLAASLPLNGISTAEISDSIAIYFVPAGYVFAIWGVIYIGLISYGYYQTFVRRADTIITADIVFAFSCIANALWLVFWHYRNINMSVVVMLFLLASLIYLYSYWRKKLSNTKQGGLVTIPMSIYLGWISVATIANISGALFLAGWDSFGIPGQSWASLMIAVAGLLAYLMMRKWGDYVFPLVIIWAVIGIALKFPNESIIITTSGIVVVILATISLLNWSQQRLVIARS